MNIKSIEKQVLGLTESAAKEIYPKIRVNSRDGKPLILTRDLRRDRLNVRVENGIITEIVDWG